MDHSTDPTSSSFPDADETSKPRIHAAWSRTRLIFWIVSSVVILALGAANITWWVQQARSEARRKALQNLWPTVYRILDQTPSIEVIALNPEGVRNEVETFHGYGVLGRTTIRDAEDIKTLSAAFLKGRRQGGNTFLCFEPRHGIHVRHGNQDLDLVICFAWHKDTSTLVLLTACGMASRVRLGRPSTRSSRKRVCKSPSDRDTAKVDFLESPKPVRR